MAVVEEVVLCAARLAREQAAIRQALAREHQRSKRQVIEAEKKKQAGETVAVSAAAAELALDTAGKAATDGVKDSNSNGARDSAVSGSEDAPASTSWLLPSSTVSHEDLGHDVPWLMHPWGTD